MTFRRSGVWQAMYGMCSFKYSKVSEKCAHKGPCRGWTSDRVLWSYNLDLIRWNRSSRIGSNELSCGQDDQIAVSGISI